MFFEYDFVIVDEKRFWLLNGDYLGYKSKSTKTCLYAEGFTYNRFVEVFIILCNCSKIGAAVITVHARDGIPPLKYALGGSKDGRAWPLVIDEDTGKVVTR